MHYQSGHETRCIKANLQYAALLNKWHDNVCEAGFKKKKALKVFSTCLALSCANTESGITGLVG